MTKISETTQDCKGQILKNTAMRRIKNWKKSATLVILAFILTMKINM